MWTISKVEFHEKLADSLKHLGENTSNCIVLIDATESNYPITYCNEAYCEMTGYSSQELVSKPYNHIFEFQSQFDMETIKGTLYNGEISKAEILHMRKDNHFFQALIECFPLLNEKAEIEFIFIKVTDITYKELTKQGNNLESRMFRAIEKDKTLFEKLMLACDAMDKTLGPDIFTTIAMKFENDLYISSAAQFEGSYTHLIPKGMARNYYSFLMNLDDSRVYNRHKGYALSTVHQQYALDNGLNSCWQIPIQIHSKEIIGIITIFFKVQLRPREFYNRFISKVINLIGLAYNYEKKQQEIHRLAYTNISTGLPNHHELYRRQQEFKEGAILVIQPSEYSKLVELYGRHFGEELLKQLAVKLNKVECVQFTAQFTSSALAVVVEANYTSYKSLNLLFERISKEVFHVLGNNIYITLKIGVAILNEEQAIEHSFRDAERALSVAKLNNGTQIAFYDNQIHEKLKKELTILNELVDALKNKEFKAYLQPKIELHRGRICGAEALARWNSPVLGFISPADFIPIAESAGLIREIDLQIAEEILKWMQKRQYEGKNIVPISINISPEHFYHPKFIIELVTLVKKYYADPKFIIIEVTESIALVDIKKAQDILTQLRLLGFRTSVDDFGIGYSSLAYLQELVFTELKLDQSFIRKIDEGGTYAIVKSIQQIAYYLEMHTVAEGIETEQQFQLVKNLGCDVGQGYYFYKPMSIDEIEEKNIIK